MPIAFHFHLQETRDLGRLTDRYASENVGRHLERSPESPSAQTTATFGVKHCRLFQTRN